MREFWSEIFSAQWLANEGVPLIGTFSAVLFAYWVLTKQLRHDRELAAAARRAEVAREFAATALSIIKSIEDHRPADPWWRMPRCIELREIYGAQERAQILLGECQIVEDVTAGVRDISHAWYACHKRIESIRQDPGINSSDLRIGDAMLTGISELFDPVVLASEELLRWDGHLPMPVFDWKTIHAPLPIRSPRTEKQKRWMDYYADQSEASLRKTIRKRSPRGLKPTS